jgi:hypothetical protein
MSVIRPNRTAQAGLLMSVDRGRPEVSVIRPRVLLKLTDLALEGSLHFYYLVLRFRSLNHIGMLPRTSS